MKRRPKRSLDQQAPFGVQGGGLPGLAPSEADSNAECLQAGTAVSVLVAASASSGTSLQHSPSEGQWTRRQSQGREQVLCAARPPFERGASEIAGTSSAVQSVAHFESLGRGVVVIETSGSATPEAVVCMRATRPRCSRPTRRGLTVGLARCRSRGIRDRLGVAPQSGIIARS